MKSFVIFFLAVLNLTISAQFSNNWVIGSNVGLTFIGNPPTSVTGGICGNADNSSAISNTAGVLQFYTDGITVRNTNHAVMPNGSGLTGSFTGGQCALIIPVPCSASKYVIFHVTDFANPGYLKYTVVDMSLNGGLGDVVVGQKNISLGSGWTEKLCAYYSSQNNCYWLVTHKWNSNEFVSFRVDANTIATTSVVSAVGSVHNCGVVSAAHDAMGQLTISQDGSKIANALTCQDRYEIFDYNPNTGVVGTNSISIPGSGGNTWGTAFSPNSQKLYVSNIFGQNIYQYDLSAFTASAVLASQYAVNGTGTSGYYFGYMELAPDGRIYLPRPGTQWFSTINNPDQSGLSCGFTFSSVATGMNLQWGTNRIAYNIPANAQNSLSLNLNPNQIICRGQSATLTSTISGGTGPYSFAWSNAIITSTQMVTPTVTTSYSLTVTDVCTNSVSALTTVSVVICDGLEETGVSSGTSIFPNPFKSEISISSTGSIQEIIIYNSLGQKVKSISEAKKLVLLEDIPAGIFFLKLQFADRFEIVKLIKE